MNKLNQGSASYFIFCSNGVVFFLVVFLCYYYVFVLFCFSSHACYVHCDSMLYRGPGCVLDMLPANNSDSDCYPVSISQLELTSQLKVTYKLLNIIVIFEPAHEIMALLVLRKLILQMRMRSHPVGLDV